MLSIETLPINPVKKSSSVMLEFIRRRAGSRVKIRVNLRKHTNISVDGLPVDDLIVNVLYSSCRTVIHVLSVISFLSLYSEYTPLHYRKLHV